MAAFGVVTLFAVRPARLLGPKAASGSVIPASRAPGGDVLGVVAIGDGAADDEEQHLGQRMQNPAHVARVLHPCEVVEQRGEAPLSKGKVSIEGIIGGSAFWVAASIQKIASLPAVI